MNYTIVGLFVLVLSVALVGITIWLSAGQLGAHNYTTYVAYMRESVAGLSVNAPVKYRGVDVGQVRSISLDPENPERVKLLLDIEPEAPVKEDTIAVLSVQGLTGIAYMELTGGSSTSAPLEPEPGEPYPVIRTGPSLLVRLDTALSNVISDLDRLTGDVDAALDEENREAFRQILDNLETLTGNLARAGGALDTRLADAEQLLANSAQASARLPQLFEQIADSVQAVETMATQFTQTGSRLNSTVQRTAPEFETFADQTLPQLTLLVNQLRTLAASMLRVSQQLERNPSELLFGRSGQPRGPGE